MEAALVWDVSLFQIKMKLIVNPQLVHILLWSGMDSGKYSKAFISDVFPLTFVDIGALL